MRSLKVFVVAAVGLAMVQGGTVSAMADDGIIDWRITQTKPGAPAGHVRLHLRQLRPNGGQMNSSNYFPLSALNGLSESELERSGSRDVSFVISRDAGRLDCEGRAGDGQGAGTCDFSQAGEFSDALAARGIERPDRGEALLLTIQDAKLSLLSDIEKAGYDTPELKDYIAFVIHGVDREYIEELSAAGVRPDDLDDLVAFRIHGVTGEFVREVRSIGPAFRDVDNDELVAMKIHGVTPTLAKTHRELGFDGLGPDDLIAFQIHGVSPRFIRELREMGYPDISGDDLVAFRIHGVSTEYLQAFMDNGYALPTPREVISMKIAGFDPRRLKREED